MQKKERTIDALFGPARFHVMPWIHHSHNGLTMSLFDAIVYSLQTHEV